MRTRELLVAMAACILASGCDSRSRSDAPNVVVIVVDTLRADRISHFGHERDTGRGLDRFASHSTVFEQAYATSSWTGPSTVSILTGLSPARHWTRFVGGPDVVKPESLAETLRSRGWRTGAVSANPAVSQIAGFGRGFDWFVESHGSETWYPDIAPALELARRWIARSREPFFLYVQPMNVHGPYSAPPAAGASLLGRPPSPLFEYWKGAMRETMTGALEARSRVDAPYLRSLEEQYDTAVRYTLDRLGHFFAELERMDVYDDTWIVVTADHGEELYDHGGFGHGFSLHEETLRVPLYVKPARSRSGARVSDPVSVIDVAPTLLDAVGYRGAVEHDGVSLVDSREEPPGASRAIVFDVQWPKRCNAKGIRLGRYKLLRIRENYEGVRDAVRLYDVADDPRETRDLASAKPDVVADLGARLDRLESQERSGPPTPDLFFRGVDAEALRSLGYL